MENDAPKRKRTPGYADMLQNIGFDENRRPNETAEVNRVRVARYSLRRQPRADIQRWSALSLTGTQSDQIHWDIP